jgi:hypothetical protein
MPKICYKPKRFAALARGILASANRVIEEYQAAGDKLTLRQLYYVFIAKDLFPEAWIDEEYNLKHNLARDTKNTLKNYKKLGEIINDGRLAGIIDWDAIEDRTRDLRVGSHWVSPHEIVRACANQYAVDMWEKQDNYVEVWVEKDALIGVLERVCTEWDVPYFSCRGYTSQSELWVAAMRLVEKEEEFGKTTTIIHLGDHDPSGIDMSRDIQARLEMFGSSATVKRIALNWDQVQEYSPPPNPAKASDSRIDGYRDRFGDECWELDALEPRVIRELIGGEIEALVDQDAWDAQLQVRNNGRKELRKVAREWPHVTEFLEGREDE